MWIDNKGLTIYQQINNSFDWKTIINTNSFQTIRFFVVTKKDR